MKKKKYEMKSPVNSGKTLATIILGRTNSGKSTDLTKLVGENHQVPSMEISEPIEVEITIR